MYCTHCGQALVDSARFCPSCGQPVTVPVQEKTKTPPAATKKARWGKWIVVILVACVWVFAVSKGFQAIFGEETQKSSDKSGKSESLFSGLVDYKMDGLLFRVPDDIKWEDEDIYDDEISLDGEDFSVLAELYDAKDLDNCDVESEEEFVDFVARAYSKNRGDYETPVIESFSSGHYIVIKGEKNSSVIGVYMKGDKAWVIGVHVYDPDDFEEYASTAEFIATSGIFRS